MPRRSRRRRSRGLRAGLVGACLGGVALAGLAALGYVYATADVAPALDPTTLCPVSGPRSVTVIVLDNSDAFADVTARSVSMRLADIAIGVPTYGLLEVRLLDPAVAGGRTVFSACNPGDGTGLSHVTGNPELARKRWLSGFEAPLRSALEGGLRGTPSKSSPILATLQRVAVDRFEGKAAARMPRTLIVVSDMVEHGPDYSQYRGDLDFGRFREGAAYARTRTDLAGAEVRLFFVQRLKGPDTVRLVRFWEAWVRDSGGRLSEAVRLQGAT